MYSFGFYLYCLAFMVMLALPCALVVGLIALIGGGKRGEVVSLASLSKSAESIGSLEELKRLYEKFLARFLTPAQSDYQEWLECVKTLSAIEVASIDEVMELKERLESSNKEHQKDISNAISVVLKNKKK